LALALLAVPAILIGLLAMHFVTTGNMSEANPSQSSVSMAAPASSDLTMGASSPTSTIVHDFVGASMPSHDMLGVMCILALVAGVIFLGMPLLGSGWAHLRRILTAVQLTAGALAPPTPPSLHVLSISRT
jgi:quinol-cytochrome oxidoreductase complex cytochrome b subunit